MKYRSILIFFVSALAFTTMSCTANFEDYNSSKTAEETITPELLFTKALVTGSPVSYTVAQNLNQTSTMVWAQHFSNIQKSFTADRHEPGPANTVWDYFYSNSNFKPMFLNYLTKQQIIEQDNNPLMLAAVEIWDAFMFQRMTDLYGDIPYSEAFNTNQPKYDTQKEIYTALVEKLDNAIEVLSNPDLEAYSFFGDGDVLFNGNKVKWIKLATSLKLRLALHQSNADPDETRRIIAGIDPDMVIQNNSDNAQILSEIGANARTHYTKNTWGFVFNWQEVRISSTLMDYMLAGGYFGVEDPRIRQYANPVEKSESGATYAGLRNGIDNGDLAANEIYYREYFSNIGPFYNSQNYEVPVPVLTASEGNFMLAEAVLKWGMTGSKTAGEYYEAAIRASLDFYQPLWTGGSAYSNAEKENYLTTSTVAWNDSETVEQKFRKLMIQKWISLYMNGPETFIEVRRTGIPEMKPVVSPYPGGNEAMPRRLMYSTDESTFNGANYSAAASRMGGDTQYTKVWIDGGN